MVLRDIPKLMDEPMNGLDNKGVEEIRTLLLQEKAKGKRKEYQPKANGKVHL